MAVIPSTPKTRRVRARLAVAKRDGHDTTELRRELTFLDLEEHIRHAVNTAPSITPEQASWLAALLRPTASADGSHAA